jgi:hypothetical protein
MHLVDRSITSPLMNGNANHTAITPAIVVQPDVPSDPATLYTRVCEHVHARVVKWSPGVDRIRARLIPPLPRRAHGVDKGREVGGAVQHRRIHHLPRSRASALEQSKQNSQRTIEGAAGEVAKEVYLITQIRFRVVQARHSARGVGTDSERTGGRGFSPGRPKRDSAPESAM